MTICFFPPSSNHYACLLTIVKVVFVYILNFQWVVSSGKRSVAKNPRNALSLHEMARETTKSKVVVSL